MRKVMGKGRTDAHALKAKEEGRADVGMVVLHPWEATVYSCRRILLYSPEEIRLASGSGCVSVVGEDLHCASFAGGTALIRGRIRSVLYPLGTPSEGGEN